MKRFLVLLLALLLLVAMGFGGYLLLNDKLRERLLHEITSDRCTIAAGEESVSLTAEQSQMASVIMAAALERKLPERASVIALATAYQESGIRNLDHGDRDSLGLFQQRPDPRFDWGTAEEIMDPRYSSLRFYDELVKFPDWKTADINDQAQAVQRSGHPEAYRKHVSNATLLAAAGHGSATAAVTCANPADLSSPNTKAVEDVLANLPGVEVVVEGPHLTITAADEASLWAAAQLALLNNYQAGITSLDVAGRTYTVGEAAWGDGGSAPRGTAVVRF